MKRWLWLVGGALVLLAVAVLFWFQPQKLWIDDRVDDTIPAASQPNGPAPSDAGVAAMAMRHPEVSDLARGTFISRDHGTSGVVRILELADGKRIVRLEGLKTDNGPDLFLYLTPAPAGGEEQAFDDGHLSLGRLKGNLGDQNYDLPTGADLGKYKSVVIWCDRFNSAFGAADLA